MVSGAANMLNSVKSLYCLNKHTWGMFKRYNYYICTVFFHGIRFKVKDLSDVGMTADFSFLYILRIAFVIYVAHCVYFILFHFGEAGGGLYCPLGLAITGQNEHGGVALA